MSVLDEIVDGVRIDLAGREPARVADVRAALADAPPPRPDAGFRAPGSA